ncbi:MAG: zinc ribbon domain-containing protein, partial [Actinobacteria bacterium]|nr:zinc ribbon domain-containing protein [Actinomycetota bacterium]
MHECPSCAQRLPDDVAFCPHCGAPVLKEQADATADPDATVELRTAAAIDPDATVELLSDAEHEPTAPLAAEDGTPTQFMMSPAAGSACPACGAATASDDRF